MVAEGRPWLTDFNIFFYELATATLLRLLQLSIPNEMKMLLDVSERVAERDGGVNVHRTMSCFQ